MEGNLRRLCIAAISRRVHLCFEMVSIRVIFGNTRPRFRSILSRPAIDAEFQSLAATDPVSSGTFRIHGPINLAA
jgi:hypothetical protein